MLSEHTRQALRPGIFALRIIVLALAAGVMVFGVVAAVQNADKAPALGANTQNIFLLLSAIMLAAGFLAPMFVPKTADAPGVASGETPEAREALRAFARIQTATIVRCAMFEGAAFMNLVWYMLHAELIHAAIAGLCWVCILSQVPFTERIVGKIEDQLRG